MLINRHTLDRIVQGEVNLAFRRWKRPTVKAGGRLRTEIGELAIDSVEIISERQVTETDARRAGYESREALLDDLRSGEDRALYRIQFRFDRPDSRIELREQSFLTTNEVAELTSRLDRLDRASRIGPWTTAVLKLVAAHPEVATGDLAARSGYEKEWLKINVRKLKNLGLTESLQPGYRLSPRGRAFLDELR